MVAVIQAWSKQQIPKYCNGHVEYTGLMHTATLTGALSLVQPPRGCCESAWLDRHTVNRQARSAGGRDVYPGPTLLRRWKVPALSR